MKLIGAKSEALALLAKENAENEAKLANASGPSAIRIARRIADGNALAGLIAQITSGSVYMPSDIRENGLYRPGYDLKQWVWDQCTDHGEWSSEKTAKFTEGYCN